MFMLVTVDQVRTALKLDSGESDTIIALYISAASRAIVRYLKGQAGSLLTIDSPPNSPPDDLSAVPEDIQMATILLTGHFYNNPDGDPDHDWEQGYLPRPVTALLYPLRDPAVA
jgi:hypothetical protein